MYINRDLEIIQSKLNLKIDNKELNLIKYLSCLWKIRLIESLYLVYSSKRTSIISSLEFLQKMGLSLRRVVRTNLTGDEVNENSILLLKHSGLYKLKI